MLMIVHRVFNAGKARGIRHTVSRKCLCSNGFSSVKSTADELGLPHSPSWSVYGLINSYPSPTLSNATLTRLHDISALKSPSEGTTEFQQLKQEMEDLVRLVEAVRIAPSGAKDRNGSPDGRVWPKDRGIVLEGTAEKEDAKGPPLGRELLGHAHRSRDGYYLVDNSKTKI